MEKAESRQQVEPGDARSANTAQPLRAHSRDSGSARHLKINPYTAPHLETKNERVHDHLKRRRKTLNKIQRPFTI